MAAASSPPVVSSIWNQDLMFIADDGGGGGKEAEGPKKIREETQRHSLFGPFYLRQSEHVTERP